MNLRCRKSQLCSFSKNIDLVKLIQGFFANLLIAKYSCGHRNRGTKRPYLLGNFIDPFYFPLLRLKTRGCLFLLYVIEFFVDDCLFTMD